MLPACIYCEPQLSKSDSSPNSVVCYGHFTRNSDQKRLQRFRCLDCRRTFSEASFSRARYQKKRNLNGLLYKLLVSGVSQRRAAIILQLNRKTIVRKFIFLGVYSYQLLQSMNDQHPKAHTVQFDDLETFEHTKCKPLSVTMAVEEGSRRILGFRVSRMPAKGLLAAISRKKYGPRKDERPLARERLFTELKDLITENCVFKSDQNPHYVPDIKKHFPHSAHLTYKGRRGCVVGQGELKGGGYDPLFSLNHSFAMARANMNRLFRRTWCTTKLPECLALHYAMYALYHNLSLITYSREV